MVADQSRERAERRVWTPELVDEQTATIRVIGGAAEAAAPALASQLLEIAERALGDRPAAERLVAAVIQGNGQLVATATRAGNPEQREAAEAALASAVRRAVLDAVPPVRPAGRPEPSDRPTATDAARSRKLRPIKGGRGAAVPGAQPGRRGRPGGLFWATALALPTLAGLALWWLVLQPSQDGAPAAPMAAGPTMPVAPEPAATLAEAPTATLPEALQLKAVEPAGGPLRPSPPPQNGSAGPSPASANGLVLPVAGGTLRVFILYPQGEPAASEAGDFYADLSRTGELPLVVLRDVDFAIGAPRIRYFHPADAGAAQAIAGYLDAPNGGWELQDFGHIRPLPAPGTIEVYVPAP